MRFDSFHARSPYRGIHKSTVSFKSLSFGGKHAVWRELVKSVSVNQGKTCHVLQELEGAVPADVHVC